MISVTLGLHPNAKQGVGEVNKLAPLDGGAALQLVERGGQLEWVDEEKIVGWLFFFLKSEFLNSCHTFPPVFIFFCKPVVPLKFVEVLPSLYIALICTSNSLHLGPHSILYITILLKCSTSREAIRLPIKDKCSDFLPFLWHSLYKYIPLAGQKKPPHLDQNHHPLAG